MAVLEVLLYPDPRLKEISQTIETIDDEVKQLVQDLTETLEASPGCVGIAAPQVGALKRLIIVDLSRSSKAQPNQGRMVLLNPVIEWQDGAVVAREGCLSLPSLTANVKRAKDVRVRAMTPDGETVEISATDFEARVILHEHDHLDGYLFLDRVTSLKTDVFKRKRFTPPTEKS